MWGRKKPDVVKGLMAGMLGGLVASFTMELFQAGLRKAAEAKKATQSEAGQGQQQEQQSGSEDEPATQKIAGAIAEKVFDTELESTQKKPAGELVHYAFGAVSGALYGAVAEQEEVATAGEGALFGSVLWLMADEIAVPLFGLSRKPTEYPLETHASALAAHIVYGVTTELVRKALRKTLLSA